jgi:hypothetical protein
MGDALGPRSRKPSATSAHVNGLTMIARIHPCPGCLRVTSRPSSMPPLRGRDDDDPGGAGPGEVPRAIAILTVPP